MVKVSYTGGRPRKDIECIEGCGRVSQKAMCESCRDKSKVKVCSSCVGYGHTGGFVCGNCLGEGYR